MQAYKSNWQESRERFAAWWRGQNTDRPLLNFWVKRETPLSTVEPPAFASDDELYLSVEKLVAHELARLDRWAPAAETFPGLSMNLGAGCVGYVTSQPDFNIQLSAADTMLRLYVTSDTDTTLIVNDASGRWHCNDDSHGGHNPTVDLSNAAPGLLNVWVGSYQSGVQARGTLHITELSSNHP